MIPEGDMSGLLAQAQAMQQQLLTAQQELAETRVEASHLVVFFPTVVATNLGFPRSGAVSHDAQAATTFRQRPVEPELVQQTADLLVEAVRWLRDNGMLDASALRCLPTNRAKFPEGAMFTPLFEAVRQPSWRKRCFLASMAATLPQHKQGWRARRSCESCSAPGSSRSCSTPKAAHGSRATSPRTARPSLGVSAEELQVPEITPDKIVVKLDKAFLEAQSDEWLTRLYGFLSGQKAIAGLFSALPLVRLDDGTHVVARENGKSNAFLPSDIETSFPTVRRAVCGSPGGARLSSSRSGSRHRTPSTTSCGTCCPSTGRAKSTATTRPTPADIERIRIAFNTDSKAQRDKLLAALRETPFVMVVDSGDGKDYVSKPGEVYIARTA